MYEKQTRIKFHFGVAVLAATVILGFMYLSLDPVRLVLVVPSFVGYIATNFFPPSFANVQVYANAVLHTVAVAMVATFISATLSFIFALLMSDAIMPLTAVRWLVRFIMTFLRSIPVVIWASIMVFIFGIGSMVGLLALVLSTVGFLSRSYAESINEIAAKKLEPLRASGVSTPRIIIHGLLPEFTPAWVNWTLFTFEINIRASAVLGMVGAGGIGFTIQTYLNLRRFNEAATLILMLIAIVLLTEFVAGLVRKKILAGNDGFAIANIAKQSAMPWIASSDLRPPRNDRTIRVMPVGVRISRIGIIAATLVIFIVSLHFANLDFARFISRLANVPRILRLLMAVNPAMVIPGLQAFFTSFVMGMVGLVLGGLFAFVLAFLAADNITPWKPLAVCIKAFVGIVRAVPGLVIILMIVAAIGFGYTTGVVALSISTMGYLTKAFIGTIEEQHRGVITAMRASGANWGQIVIHGLLPAVATGFLAWVAIRLETSVAESITLGIVGAGGIGTLLRRATRTFDYPTVTTLILIIFICMFILELIVGWVRRRFV